MTTNEPNDNASRLIELEFDSHSRFVELIDATVSSLNHAASLSPDEYSRLSPSAVEEKVLDHLRVQCERLGLDKHCATLVSGKRFPDIKIGKCYGIEVKSTQSDKWTLIGGSTVMTGNINSMVILLDHTLYR